MALSDRLEDSSTPRGDDARRAEAVQRARVGAAPMTLYAAALALLALHVLRSLPALGPSLRDIGDWDESWYIHWGYRLHQLHHPALSANPIVGALYAVLYPFAKGADPWLVEACRLGRAVFCVASWLVLFAIVRECASLVASKRAPGSPAPWWSWMAPVLLFTASAVPSHLLATPNYQWGNPSDATFAVVSGLAFWQLLRFHVRGRTRSLAFASGLLGVSVLARVDGLILSLVALTGVLALNARNGKLRSLVWPALLPFGAVVGTFLALYAAVAGTLEQGISSRSYQAFEEGQTALGMSIADWKDYQLRTRPLAFDGDLAEARALFGTSGDNGGSVLRALIRHPQAGAERLARTLATVPAQVVAAYGELVVFPLFALAFRGVRELLTRRSFGVLAACLCWVLPLGSYLFFFYRPGYFILPFFVPFALATVGLHALVASSSPARDRSFELALVALGVGSALFGPAWLAAGAALTLALFVVARFAREGRRFDARGVHATGLVVASVAALLTLVADRVASQPASDGAEERAVRVLRQKVPERSNVGAYGPGPIWAANPTYEIVRVESPEGDIVASRPALERWLVEHRVSAVYMNRALELAYPESAKVLSAAVGDLFDVGFEDARSGVRVLLTRRELLSTNTADPSLHTPRHGVKPCASSS